MHDNFIEIIYKLVSIQFYNLAHYNVQPFILNSDRKKILISNVFPIVTLQGMPFLRRTIFLHFKHGYTVKPV
jgi:hypothetical protein